ncbi:MAG: glycosyltransferase [Rhodocyclaceae bacterium]|jgi:glycosyltransferase involved in cell wall biosynthesis|nr:glycosyltransferase [Rhodocyclaceae bacterium]
MPDDMQQSCGRAWPSISVVIPAYNAERFVLDALRSVIDQDWPTIEILLIDDGSTDKTVDLVKKETPQVTILQQANAGVAAARNTGLKAAKGEMICFLDADDGWFSGKLEAQVDYLEKHPEVGIVYHRWQVWDPEKNPRPEQPSHAQTSNEIDATLSGWIYPQLLLDCIVHTSTVMMRREVFEKIGFFDPTLEIGEDYDYWLRASRHFQFHKLARVYSYYRQSPDSLTRSPKSKNYGYDLIARAVAQWGRVSPDGSVVPGYALDQRLAELAYGFGYAHYHRGSMMKAKESFARVLRHQPGNWRALAYWMLAGLSSVRKKNST